MRGTGDWVLRFLCLTLAITPLRRWTGWTALARLRRMLGLFSFFYAVLHFLCYAWLDMGFDAAAIVRDIPKRPFVLVGTLALLLMVPLAATSFQPRHQGNRCRTLARSCTEWSMPGRAARAAALLLDAQREEQFCRRRRLCVDRDRAAGLAAALAWSTRRATAGARKPQARVTS